MDTQHIFDDDDLNEARIPTTEESVRRQQAYHAARAQVYRMIGAPFEPEPWESVIGGLDYF